MSHRQCMKNLFSGRSLSISNTLLMLQLLMRVKAIGAGAHHMKCVWDGTPNTCIVKVHSTVVFLGDSTMSHLAKQYRMQHTTRHHRCSKSASRCNLDEYLGIQKSIWIHPPSMCGPVAYGLGHPWCTDCSGCNAFLCGNTTHSVEYVPIEFACDVSMQSDIHTTTQSVISHYLRQRQTKQSCIVNVGLHDEMLRDANK